MLGSLIGAGASLLGGLFGNKSQEKANERNIAAQREFAQHGIRWKVDDAKAAGIHPLYALGAQTHAFSPSFVGSTAGGEGIAQAGQHIARGIEAKQTAPERAYNAKVMQLTLQRGELENALLASQIARIGQAGHPPPLPGGPSDNFLIPGQGNTASPLVNDVSLERTVADPTRKHQEPGAITDVGHARTQSGGVAPVMSGDVKQRLEEDLPGMLQWNARNRLGPYIDDKRFAPPYDAPPGKVWHFNPFYGEYYLLDARNTPRDSIANQ